MRFQLSIVGARALTLLIAAIAFAVPAVSALANPEHWKPEWPRTDFTKHSIDYGDVLSGGPPKDGIPSIDEPKFVKLSEIKDIAATEPVIGLEVNGVARAYPLRVLTWHEIANDVIGGVPIAATYCPLCNAAIVFDRRVDGQVLEFGTTGKLRNSDLIMYDRQTDSWWQQFLGEGIVGEMTGKRLDVLPSRLESFEKFAARHPDGEVLVPNDPDMRSYGANPYVGYDGSGFPFLYKGSVPEGIAPLGRVVVVGDTAWTLDLLREKGRIEKDDVVITWEPGQNSALNTRAIADGQDVGNVVAQKRDAGGLKDIVYDVTFAFVFLAFKPDGTFIDQ